MTNTERHITKSYYEAFKKNGNNAAVLVPNILPLEIVILGIIVISILGVILG